jgi:hypothetical protein
MPEEPEGSPKPVGEAEGIEYPRLRPIDVQPVEVDGRQALALRDPEHYAESVLCVSPDTAGVLGLLDGRNSLLDIQAAFSRRYGELLFREQLLGLLRSLDEHLLLDSPRFAAHKAAVDADYRRAAARPAFFAGMSYPDDPAALRRFLDGLFDVADGPGATPPSPEAARMVGLVVPHIDLPRGGYCYGWGYREAEGLPPVDRWVILGTAHAPMRRPFALTRKAFETPLGAAEVDQECLDRLLERVGEAWLEGEMAHRGEHSIEFQAVFLRHRIPAERPLCILPVLCGSFQEFVEARRAPDEATEAGGFLAALREVLRGLPGRTVVVASADLAHVGGQFGDPWPVTPGRLREIAAADREALDAVVSGDAEAFFQRVARDGDRRRVCGLPPIYAALRLLHPAEGRLLKYGQWPDPSGTVTFAAAALYGKGHSGNAK